MRRSLSARLSFWIVLASALLFFALIVYLGRMYNYGIHQEVDKDAVQVLDNAVHRVDDIVDDVERATRVLAWTVSRDLDHPDEMIVYSNAAVLYNSLINSCSVSFEPWYYPTKGEYYSIFSWRKQDGTIGWEQEGDDEYRYFDKIWYLQPKQMGMAGWTEPYTDYSDTDDPAMNTEMMVSYCNPLYDPKGVFVGSVSLDLSIRRLSEQLANVKPYPHAFCILVGDKGTYLVHPDAGKLFYQTIFSDAREQSLPELQELGEAMSRMESGKREFKMGDADYSIFFHSIPTTGWSMALFCPEEDIYGGYRTLQRSLLLSILAALLLMFFLFVWLIRRQLAPLGHLADEADYIASGNFDRPLPPVGHNDEIGLLNRSFQHMQSSLVLHIQKLTESTSSRERIERELQIARNIQMGMVPHDFNLGVGVDLFASMTPAREVGGDLYDFFVQDGKLYFCVGDVSGKGVPASLVMAVSLAMFRIVARQGMSPSEIASRINDTIAEKNEQMIFITMFIGAIDLASGSLDYCNCGHNAPVMISGSGAPVFIDCKANTAVGIISGFAYEGQRIEDLCGNVLFIYTDGLNEAENDSHEQFGNERMLNVLGSEPFVSSQATVERLSRAVAAHVAGAEPSDDLTMLCLRITPGSPTERR